MKNNYQRGFIKEILLIVIAIIILSYFGVSIKEVLDKEAVKNNFFYVWEGVVGFFKYVFNFIISLVSKN